MGILASSRSLPNGTNKECKKILSSTLWDITKLGFSRIFSVSRDTFYMHIEE
jgi:hypothetical protein